MNIQIKLPKWNIEEISGYKPITTFWQDFSIADKFGTAAVKDTYRRAVKDWNTDYKYMTELCLVLNHKIWQHYKENEELTKIYDTLWRKLNEHLRHTLKGDELIYYLHTTD